MNFFEKLDQVRARPEAERDRLAIWIALLLTLIIGSFWLLGLRGRWQTRDLPPPEPAEASFWVEAKTRIIQGWKTITTK